MMSTEIEGILEVDHDRGVIYFHSKSSGTTVLRIRSLPKPIPHNAQLDITHMVGANWSKEK